MKSKLIKTLCLGSAVVALPLVSCSQQQNTESKIKASIKSSFFNQMLELTNNKQLKNKQLWKKFVDVFHDHEDTKIEKGANWRCEFWGKMMRGAALCYKYSHDQELYDVITESIKDMLARGQDENGRFSTYEVDKEFKSWDLWGRKYVLTAMLHYYGICQDAALKDQIITALKRHADYILSKIGEGKISIVDTGYKDWKSINSSSILEPMVNLYEVTHEQRYLDFCTYIVNTGGIKDGNIIEEAKNESLRPHEFSVKKAYETMSFFEGVYRYAKVIKNEELKRISISFFNRVAENEVTVVGGAGCKEEQFNHSKVTQVIPHNPEEAGNQFGQETCVTVTWMRILNLLYEETHDIKYYEMFSQSALNAFLGTLNLYNQKTCIGFRGAEKADGIPFDSYSPLCFDARGLCTGGLVKFLNPDNVPLYGCCVCIAPASIGLMGLNYCREFDNRIYLNEYYQADLHNEKTIMNITGDYLSHGKALININSSSNKELMLRIPEWANNPEVKINGQTKQVTVNNYFNAGALKDIKNIELNFNPKLEKLELENKVYFKFGQYILAVDQYNNHNIDDLSKIQAKNIAVDQAIQVSCALDEFVRFEIPYGNEKLIFTNYASAGRKSYYSSGESYNLTVFFNKE